MSKYYKHPQFGHVYGGSLRSPIGRACWPSLITPKDPPPPQPGQPAGQPRFEVTVLLDKGTPETDAFIAQLEPMSNEMLALFNEKRAAPLGGVRLLQDGDTFDMEKYPYYKGKWVLCARNAKETKVYGRDKKEVGREKIVGGVKVVLVVTPMITAHGLSFKLETTQLVEDDGTRFGGGVRDMSALLDNLDGPEDAPPVMNETGPATNGAPAAEAPKPKQGKKAAIDLL